MFSTTSEYALRAMTYLARVEASTNSEQIASKTQIPKPFLSKILRDLVVGKLIHGQRGPNGGFVLAKPADQITVLDVVNAVDPVRRVDRCPLDLPEHSKRLCPLHETMAHAIEQAECLLDQQTLAQLIARENATHRSASLR